MTCGSIRLNSRPEAGNEARYSSLDSRPEPGNEARYSSLDSRPELGNEARHSSLDSRPEAGNEARYSSLDSRPEPGNEARHSSLDSRPEPGNEARYSSLDSRPEPGNEARYSSLDSRPDNACFHVRYTVNLSQLPTHLVFHKVQRSPPDDTRTNVPIHLAANHSNIKSFFPLLQLRAGMRSKTSLEQIPDTTLLLKV